MPPKTRLALVIAATAFLNACGSSDDDDNAVTMAPEIPSPLMDDTSGVVASGVVSQDQLASMRELGFVSNDGDDPPVIEGSFLHAPVVLQASNISDDQGSIGDVFDSVIIEFSNQDMEQQTADLTFTEFFGDEVGDVSRSINSFVTGNGLLFTAYFAVIDVASTDESPTDTIALSGEMTANGIINLQEAFFDFDTGTGVSGSTILGRVFIDQDGFSEIVVEQNEALEAAVLTESAINLVRFRDVIGSRLSHGARH